MTNYNDFYKTLETKIKKNNLVKFKKSSTQKQILDLKKKITN